MFGFRRDKTTEISRKRRSQELLMTADIDAKLPNKPSLESYKVDVLSLDSVVHLFNVKGNPNFPRYGNRKFPTRFTLRPLPPGRGRPSTSP